jgi:hypothetical protein
MPASPANRPKRRAKRAKTPLATVAALCALAAPAAFAPAPAAAVINNPGANCIPPNPGDQVFWNNGSWCQVQEGQGGTGSTGTTAGSGGGATIYWASSDAPRDPVVECLRQNAGTCMPVQRGGPGSRGVLEGKEGPIAGQRGNGSKAAGRSETARPKTKPKPASKRLCVLLSKDLNTPENRAVLAYIKRTRSRTLDLSGTPFRDPEMEKKVPAVDRKLQAWRDGQCRDQLPGGMPLGF